MKAKFHVDFNQPVNEDGPHLGIDVILAVHVLRRMGASLDEGSGVRLVLI